MKSCYLGLNRDRLDLMGRLPGVLCWRKQRDTGRYFLRGVVEGWSFQGWFVSTGSRPVHIRADPFEWSESEPTRATRDARAEHLRVEDQARFLITLEPVGAEPGVAPAGFPVFVAVLQG